MGIKRGIAIVMISIIIILLIHIRLLDIDNNNLIAKLRESNRLNAVYVSQMTILQQVQNGIYVSEIERDKYLKMVWDYNQIGGK